MSEQKVEYKQKGDEADPEQSKDIPSEKGEHYIGQFEKAPRFVKDNIDITHGYRINFDTPRRIVRSLFMVHNETVNIWSHCLPAIFIIVFIVTFYFMVDGESMRRSLNQYQSGLKTGVNHYMHALDNLSLIGQYDEFSKNRWEDVDELKRTVLTNYEQFTSKIHQTSKKYQGQFEEQFEGVKTSIKDTFQNNKAQFERAKRQFQTHLAPLLVQEVNQKLNSTWFIQLKEKVQILKRQMDSDYFKLIDQTQNLPNPQEISRWPIFVFLFSAAFCLLTSTIFHLFHPMSNRTYLITNRFDYAGVNILISGSVFPPFYYGMYCQLQVAIFYLTCTICIAVFCFVVCLFEWIHKPGHQQYKGWMFAGFGLSMAIPVSHMVINEVFFGNYGDPFEFSSSLPYIILLAASYLGGVYIYVIRCPQRNSPGKYNICGHSHQIWHGFVLFGILFTYLGAIKNFQMRKMSYCPA